MQILENLIKFIEKEGKVELSEDFKSKLGDALKAVVSEKSLEIDGLKEILGEAKEEIVSLRDDLKTLKEGTLEDVKKEVEGHKEELTEKLSKYLETELGNLIPESLIEAQAKVEAYEPIVEKVKAVFTGFGVEINSAAHEVLKEAKEEIISLQESYDKAIKEKLALEAKAEELLAKYVLKEKCEGLTSEQSDKIAIVFKGASADEITEKFESIVDLIINESSNDEDDDKGDGKGSVSVNEDVNDLDGNLNEQEDLGQEYLNL